MMKQDLGNCSIEKIQVRIYYLNLDEYHRYHDIFHRTMDFSSFTEQVLKFRNECVEGTMYFGVACTDVD